MTNLTGPYNFSQAGFKPWVVAWHWTGNKPMLTMIHDATWCHKTKMSRNDLKWKYMLILMQKSSWFHGHFRMSTGLSVDLFCWGSGAPTIWISKGPKQNLKGPSIEIHYQFSNFGGSIGPPGKISQGPHWIFRGPGPLPPGPQVPWSSKVNS